MQSSRVRVSTKLLTVALTSIAWSHLVIASDSRAQAPRSGVHDFDFLVGEWRVHHRSKRGTSAEWQEFEGTCTNRALAGGAANMEEHTFQRPTGVTYGVATRAYDAKSGDWAIWWIDSRDPHLPQDPPMKGRFGPDGVGLFYSEFIDKGAPTRVRFIWSRITPMSARWEQAFSTDAGRTWDTNWVMDFRRKDAVSCCSVFELRQYTLKPRQRDVLIELFDREFIETQEAHGMRIAGQFRDLEEPDQFVWMRAFTDMEARERALTTFYTGQTWRAFGKKAAATMIDSDNVLLLRPVDPAHGPAMHAGNRPPRETSATSSSHVSATIYHLRPEAAAAFPVFFRDRALPALRDAGMEPIATFETESAPNTYPLLPVREGERVFVWLARFTSAEEHASSQARLNRSPAWTAVERELSTQLHSPTQYLRLQPTARSLLR